MNKNFTLDDLILYAYNETDLIGSVRIQQAIDENQELCDDYVEMVDTMRIMDTLMKEPSEKTIQSILDYSKSTVPDVAEINH